MYTHHKKIDTLINEIKVWADHNFDFHAPELGIIEEIGEYTHQLLKKAQKIRVTSDELEKDALADMAIFYFHLCSRTGHLPYEMNLHFTRLLRWHLGQLTHFAAKILCCIADGQIPDTLYMVGFWEQLNTIVHCNGWDLEVLVDDVWSQVRLRDFRKYPGTGLPPKPDDNL